MSQASEVEDPCGPGRGKKWWPRGREVRAQENKGGAEGRAGGGRDPGDSATIAVWVAASKPIWSGRLDPATTRAAGESCNSHARWVILTNKTWRDVGRIICGFCHVPPAALTNPLPKAASGKVNA